MFIKLSKANKYLKRQYPELSKAMRNDIIEKSKHYALINVRGKYGNFKRRQLVGTNKIDKKELEKRINSQEYKIKNENIEWGIGFNFNGKKLFKTTSNSSKYVELTPTQEKKIKNNIFIHNHTFECMFSDRDIFNLIRCRVKQARAVTSQNIYIVELPDNILQLSTKEHNKLIKEFIQFSNKTIHILKEKYYKNKEITIKDLEILSIKYNKEIKNKYGLKYKKKLHI